MSKLSLHLQSCPGWVNEFVAQSGVQWIKWIDPPAENPWPGIKTVARYYIPDSESNNMIWRGAAGAREWWARIRPRLRSWCWAHEGPNEPQPMADARFRRALNEFTIELARLMRAEGYRLVGLNWAVGWPDVGHAPEFRDSLAVIDYLGLHEYGAPTIMNNSAYLALRHRRTIHELRDAGCRVPPILIGETGIDGGVINQPLRGWRNYTDEAGYLAQLQALSAELDKTPEVLASFIFTVCDWDWHSFNIPPSLGLKLAEFIAAGRPAEPSRPPPEGGETQMGNWAQGFFASRYQGQIEWNRVREAGYSYVHICASGPTPDRSGVEPDPTFAANWEGAGRAGLLRSVWHGLHPTATGQARLFYETVGPRRPELGAFGDFEGAVTVEKASQFLEAADRWFNTTVGVYTSAGWLKASRPPWGHRPLWLAQWTTAPTPTVPPIWQTWTFWQWTGSTGTIPGVPGRVCLDRFNGTAEELRARYARPAEPPAGPDDLDFRRRLLAALDEIIVMLRKISAG